ncbi:protein of unknown function [Acidithiobacillus ferrivorans]|uniref:Uncharacterized protein n=2 Tax=Acidithiobacillus ferrivorans TaxID=160808 RepID=A0ABY1MUR0_9PROT|nr:protein of unknown function [Acidithiobacillus ferrivorans]
MFAGMGTVTDEWRLCAVVLDSRVLRVVAEVAALRFAGGMVRNPAGWPPPSAPWITTTRVWTAFASICWMMRPRGLVAGHADLAIYAAKAARKDQFQWVE